MTRRTRLARPALWFAAFVALSGVSCAAQPPTSSALQVGAAGALVMAAEAMMRLRERPERLRRRERRQR
jgi:hypothetical protein